MIISFKNFTFLALIMVFTSIVKFARISRYVRPKLKDLYNRRMAQGPEPYRHPSLWNTWNFDAELFAFKNRIEEKFSESELLEALKDVSYTTDKENNSDLAKEGESIAKKNLFSFVSKLHNTLPKEWLDNIVSCLMSENHLANSACKIGLKDLVLYQPRTEPPNNKVLSDSLLAFITVVDRNSNETETFVRDIIAHVLYDKDVTEAPYCPESVLKNPFAYYQDNLSSKDDSLEFRLIDQSAMGTILACYSVGLFKNKNIVGEGAGETLEIAIDQATMDSIRNHYELEDSKSLMQAFQ